MNEIRGLLFEYGVVIPRRETPLIKKLRDLLSDRNHQISPMMKDMTQNLFSELLEVNEKISGYESKLKSCSKNNETYKRLDQIKGFGLMTITALIVALADPKVFKNGRQFAAWLGLVPKHTGTGGQNKIMGISKRGDSYLRKLMVHGARSVRIKAEKNINSLDPLEKWVLKIDRKKGSNVASVALVNKNARIAWALVAHSKDYNKDLAARSSYKIAA